MTTYIFVTKNLRRRYSEKSNFRRITTYTICDDKLRRRYSEETLKK